MSNGNVKVNIYFKFLWHAKLPNWGAQFELKEPIRKHELIIRNQLSVSKISNCGPDMSDILSYIQF